MINSNPQNKSDLNTKFTGPLRLLAAAVAATSLSAVTAPAQGGLMRDMALDPQHRSFGQSYLAGGSALAATGGGTAAFRLSATPTLPFAANASITLLNSRWGAVALHEVADYLAGGGTVTGNVQTGSNYNSSPGFTSAIRRVIPIPGGSGSNPALADFCLVEFDPIPGVNDAVLGNFPGVGQNVAMSGYGRYGSEAAGIFPRDGNVRGWLAPVSSFLAPGYNPAYYIDARVGSSSSQSLLGRGLSGDSGGAVFDMQGRTIGIISAGTNGGQFAGSTTILRFDNPEISSFISSNIPTPSSAALLGLAATAMGMRRRRAA